MYISLYCWHTQCQCQVTSEIVSRLLGDVISLMKHVKLYHGIFGTHIPIHAMSIYVTTRIVFLLLGEANEV